MVASLVVHSTHSHTLTRNNNNKWGSARCTRGEGRRSRKGEGEIEKHTQQQQRSVLPTQTHNASRDAYLWAALGGVRVCCSATRTRGIDTNDDDERTMVGGSRATPRSSVSTGTQASAQEIESAREREGESLQSVGEVNGGGGGSSGAVCGLLLLLLLLLLWLRRLRALWGLEADLQRTSTAIDRGAIEGHDSGPSVFETRKVDEAEALALGGRVVTDGLDVRYGAKGSEQAVERVVVGFGREVVDEHTVRRGTGGCYDRGDGDVERS